ncbi:MAG TPA: S41 family peptidase [Pyrinomonadaceae bacterium]|nr:S41 family peptidase [Pyrinomonadaceae bacterium]
MTSRKLFAIALATFLLVLPIAIAHAQKVEAKDRDRGLIMLDRIKDEIKKHYYDPNFRGMNLDVRFKTASDKIKESTSVGQIFGVIAQVLIELDDTHTFFIPPGRVVETDYGWTMMMVGDRCYVSSVDEGSDAEAKGVKPGDEILQVGGWSADRKTLWKIQYLYNTLRPQAGMRVVIRSPNSQPKEIDLLAKQKMGQQVTDLTDYNTYIDMVRKSQRDARAGRDRYMSFGDQVLIWKMNEFDLTDAQVDDAMSRAKKHKTLILDLRGNSGGWVTTISRLISNLFDKDVKIGDSKTRKETKPEIAKTRGDKAYAGKLIILVDSRSASASEVLARTVQLEKRGLVVGDRTAGAVMASRMFGHQVGIDVVVFFGVSVTVSDLIMADGNTLEHVGVTPDEVRLPTAEDMAANRDTVLAYAASLGGVTLDPAEAGKFFPIEIKKKD